MVTNHEIMKFRWAQTCRDVCDKVCDKPVRVAQMEFSPLQCMTVRDTQIMKVGDTVCIADFYDLCP